MGKPNIPFLPRASAIIVLCLVSATALPARGGNPAPRQPAWVEPGVDRPGSDFKILWLRGGPETCQEACAQNPLCKSYTYVREGVGGGRMEGCWLKDDVPPPVEDGCCVSGVKTSETVSRVARNAPLPARQTPRPAVDPARQPLAPETPAGKPEKPRKAVPLTGSGKRGTAGMNFAAVPPVDDEEGKRGLPVVTTTSPAEAGAGIREATGMDFTAAPLLTATRPITSTVTVEAPATGTGRREIRGVHYTVLHSTAESPVPGGQKTGTATRKISGVNITAVPSQR